jgi:hypothetical protein
MRKTLLALFFTVCFSGALMNASIAQSQYNYPIPALQAPKKAKFKTESRKATGKEIIIPDLPRYPGGRFISGEEKKSKDGGMAYSVKYSIPKSSQSQVVPFYANIFNGGGWRISQQTEENITAMNTSKYASSSVTVSSDGDSFSLLEVNYAVLPIGQ